MLTEEAENPKKSRDEKFESMRQYIGNRIYLRLLSVTIILMTWSCQSTWVSVYDRAFEIGSSAPQNFSKQNLNFKVDCLDGKTKITFYQPEELARRGVYDYLSGTEIHYDEKHYLVLTKIGNDCRFNGRIFHRRKISNPGTTPSNPSNPNNPNNPAPIN